MNYTSLLLALVVVACAGCGGTQTAQTSAAASETKPLRVQSADLDIRLHGALGDGDPGTLVRDAGWLEYQLTIENRGTRPLTIRNVKLLTREGRYFDSASAYQEITAPPDMATEVAQDVAVRSAGIAAGQVIPYGGTIVGILSGAASASAAQSKTSASRDFALRRLKDVELAPGGRVRGSAFLPSIADASTLVLLWERGEASGQVDLPLRGGG